MALAPTSTGSPGARSLRREVSLPLSIRPPFSSNTSGIAPSANMNPEKKVPSLFEPVHGSAPDIYGKKIANPVGMIWAGAMMLDHLGCEDAGAAVSERRSVPKAIASASIASQRHCSDSDSRP